MYSTIKESFIENVLKFLQCIRSLWQLTQWILSPSFRQSDQRSFRHYLRTNHSQAFSKSMLSYRQRQRLHLCDQNSMLCLKVNLTHMHQLMGTYDKYDESIITICWATNNAHKLSKWTHTKNTYISLLNAHVIRLRTISSSRFLTLSSANRPEIQPNKVNLR